MLIQIFYWALDQMNKIMVDNTSRGSLVKLPYKVVSNVLNQVTILTRGRHTRDIKVSMGALSVPFVCYDQRKRDEERGGNMTKVMT